MLVIIWLFFVRNFVLVLLRYKLFNYVVDIFGDLFLVVVLLLFVCLRIIECFYIVWLGVIVGNFSEGIDLDIKCIIVFIGICIIWGVLENISSI